MKHPLFTFSILIALLWAPSIELHAQRNVSRSADEAFERHQYSLALDRYKKAYGKVKRNSDERSRISYRMAECYRFTGSTKRAEATYKRVLRTDLVDRYPEIYLIYADLLKMNQKFEESIEYYQLYTERQPDDPRGRLGAETASLAAEWLENPSRFEVELLKNSTHVQPILHPHGPQKILTRSYLLQLVTGQQEKKKTAGQIKTLVICTAAASIETNNGAHQY